MCSGHMDALDVTSEDKQPTVVVDEDSNMNEHSYFIYQRVLHEIRAIEADTSPAVPRALLLEWATKHAEEWQTCDEFIMDDSVEKRWLHMLACIVWDEGGCHTQDLILAAVVDVCGDSYPMLKS